MALARRTVHSLGGPTYIPDARVQEQLATRQQQLAEDAFRFQQEQAQRQFHGQQAQNEARARQDAARLGHDRLVAFLEDARKNRKLDIDTFSNQNLQLDRDRRYGLDRDQLDYDRLRDDLDRMFSGHKLNVESGDRRYSTDSVADAAMNRLMQGYDRMAQDKGIAETDHAIRLTDLQQRGDLADKRSRDAAESQQQQFVQSLVEGVLGQRDAVALENIRAGNRYDLAQREDASKDRRSLFSTLIDYSAEDKSQEEQRAALQKLQSMSTVLSPELGALVEQVAPSMLGDAGPNFGTRVQELLGYVPYHGGQALSDATGLGMGDWIAPWYEGVMERAAGEREANTQASREQLTESMADNPFAAMARAVPGQSFAPVGQPDFATEIESVLRLAELLASRIGGGDR